MRSVGVTNSLLQRMADTHLIYFFTAFGLNLSMVLIHVIQNDS